jgi:hypothetical protein
LCWSHLSHWVHIIFVWWRTGPFTAIWPSVPWTICSLLSWKSGSTCSIIFSIWILVKFWYSILTRKVIWFPVQQNIQWFVISQTSLFRWSKRCGWWDLHATVCCQGNISIIYMLQSFWTCFCTLCGRSLLREKWLCENTVISILDYVEYFRHKFTRACEIEHNNLKQSQVKIETVVW